MSTDRNTAKLRVVPSERSIEDVVEHRLSDLFGKFGSEHLDNLYALVIERVEKALFTTVLRHTKNNQVRAAQILGISRNTLRRKLKAYKMN